MSGEEKEKISLDNFNYQSKNQRLTSPSSIQACKLQGVTEKDIIYLTFEEYIQSHPESLTLQKEFQQERYDNYEQNRKDLVESLKETRNQLKDAIIKQEKTEKTETDDYNDDFYSTKGKTATMSKDQLRKMLKEDLENTIKIQIENELEKKKKRNKKAEGSPSMNDTKMMSSFTKDKEIMNNHVKSKKEINE